MSFSEISSKEISAGRLAARAVCATVFLLGSGLAASAMEPDLWVAFEDRCLESYLAAGSPDVDGLIEVEPARESQRSFRSPDESLLMILESAPEEGRHACLLYGFHTSDEPAGQASFEDWRSEVLGAGDFELDDIGRLTSTNRIAGNFRVDARTGENVTVYEVLARD